MRSLGIAKRAPAAIGLEPRRQRDLAENPHPMEWTVHIAAAESSLRYSGSLRLVDGEARP